MNVAEVKGFSEAEWSILDYFGTEVVRLALKLETISLAKERVWVIEEACKYVRDIEGFLNNREMNDPFTLSHYITNFSPNSLQTRVFIRVILSGISQIIFQEEKYHEETYKMLGSIADIYIPCLLTHQSMDSNVLQFILDLKTQLVIFGARCGEDLNHLIDSNFKTKKRSLTNLNGIKIESQLRKSHKRLLKSRRAEIFSVSSDMLVKRYPWREFVHNAHEFLHQMSQLIPNSVLFGRNNLSDHSTMELPPKTGRTTHLYESVNEGNKRLQLGRQSNPVLAIVKDEEAISNFINQDQPHFNEPIGSDQRLTKKRRRASDEHSSLGSIGGSCIASSSEVNSMQDRLFFRDSVFSNYSQGKSFFSIQSKLYQQLAI
ncbi:TTAGGG repeat binding factor, variant 2 [Basidiobolus ranarum]|uniref:TTAGGG repeat binding factor, variant 2 n=1 Tax=Basidiobolus ranarum TaxID=34480 RepID=A0ABR2WTP8_9FUNG